MPSFLVKPCIKPKKNVICFVSCFFLIFSFFFFFFTLWRQRLQAQLHRSSWDEESSGLSTAGTRSTEERMWQRRSYTSKGKECEESSFFFFVNRELRGGNQGLVRPRRRDERDLEPVGSVPPCLPAGFQSLHFPAWSLVPLAAKQEGSRGERRHVYER